MGAALTGCWPAAPDGPSPLPLQKARGVLPPARPGRGRTTDRDLPGAQRHGRVIVYGTVEVDTVACRIPALWQ